MQGREAVEATEVCHVQCKDMADAVTYWPLPVVHREPDRRVTRGYLRVPRPEFSALLQSAETRESLLPTARFGHYVGVPRAAKALRDNARISKWQLIGYLAVFLEFSQESKKQSHRLHQLCFFFSIR